MKFYVLYFLLILLHISCGDGINNPNGFSLDDGKHYLFVANAEDNNISVVKIVGFNEIGKYGLGKSKYPNHISNVLSRNEFIAVCMTGEDPNSEQNINNLLTDEYKVLILKFKNGEIVKEIKLNKMPTSSKFINKELWIGLRDKDKSEILIYNTNDWSLSEKIELGGGLEEIDYHKNSLLISLQQEIVTAPNSIDGTIDIIDAISKKIIKTIKVGDNPINAKIGENYISVSNLESQSISLISLKTLELETTIQLNFKPYHAIDEFEQFNNVNSSLWVTQYSDIGANSRLYMYLKNGNRWEIVLSKIGSNGTHSLGILTKPNSLFKYIFYTNQSENTLSYYKITSNYTDEKTIKVGKKPTSISICELLNNPDPRFE